MDDLLKQAFVLWEKLLPHVQGKAVLSALLDAYAAPGRYYHTTEHIAEMTLLLGEYRERLSPGGDAFFACLWHDIVYDARRSDNEEQSAARWKFDAEALKIPPAQINTVAEMILATRKHEPANDSFEMRLFLDADLAILGASPERYAAYAEGVRREYAHVSDGDYRAGRSAVLKRFLERPQLYFTAEVRDRCEAKARKNIAMEIHSLAAKSP